MLNRNAISFTATLYSGADLTRMRQQLFLSNPNHFPAIWCYCSSPEYQ